MGKKILIDLIKCRECGDCVADCTYTFHPGNKGIIALKELAAFAVSCRKCKDAPCVAVCPAEALEKNENEMLVRAVNLCIACKSCVTICPFGTMLNDLFESRKSICNYCEMDGTEKDLLCIRTCPEGALELTEQDEDPAKNIYQVNDKVLVKDYMWDKMVELE
jgi:Fe-S-cluster-containing hydrogenase component 2